MLSLLQGSHVTLFVGTHEKRFRVKYHKGTKKGKKKEEKSMKEQDKKEDMNICRHSYHEGKNPTQEI